MSYVYLYLDSARPGRYEYQSFSLLFEPFYVGKGSRSRDVSHLKHSASTNYRLPFYDKLRSLVEPPYIIRIQNGLQHVDALELEKRIIIEIGRRCFGTGPLLNLRDGGSEYGLVSEETRRRLSESHRGQIAWNKGKQGVQIARNKGIPATQHFRDKVSASLKGRPAWNKGLRGVTKFGPPSLETRENIRKSKQKIWTITNPKGYEITVFDLKEFCRLEGLTYANMCAVGRGLRKHHKYYKIRRSNAANL